jgi:glycerol uptake facilitator-like aquaporin
MLRKESSFGTRRLLGIIYIAGQLLGGIAAALISIFLSESNKDANDNEHTVAQPMLDSEGSPKVFSSIISEILGTFIMVLIFMLSTQKST